MITLGGQSILGSKYLQNCSTIAASDYISEASDLENILDSGRPNHATVDIGIFNK